MAVANPFLKALVNISKEPLINHFDYGPWTVSSGQASRSLAAPSKVTFEMYSQQRAEKLSKPANLLNLKIIVYLGIRAGKVPSGGSISS
jgi:hypothetical protein